MTGINVLRTPLYNLHVELGAKMVDFAGWEMPLLYRGIVEEHLHTRRAAALFDISHMGRIELRGRGAEALLQRTCTRQLGDMPPGQSRYSHVCHERGGIIDDVIVSRFDEHWLVVCNACNRSAVLDWLRRHAPAQDVQINDVTESTLMIALQGPQAVERLNQFAPEPLGDLRRYHFRGGQLMVFPYTVFRCGYTGEDGVEIILPAVAGPLLSGFGVQAEREQTIRPAGLGARDTLRLEAALPLYGHELHAHADSLSAGLGWCVDLNKDFIGAAALREIARQGPRRQLLGLELEGRRIARQHNPVLRGGEAVGAITSGTFAPSLQRSIALAYVNSEHAQPGQALTVEIGGKQADARVVPLPFYKR